MAVLCTPTAFAQWSTGVGGDGSRFGLTAETGPTTPTILWQGSLPGIVAQQAVVDGNLVVVNRIESFTIPIGTWIVAHDLRTGAILWQVQLPMSFPDAWRSRVTAIRDGRVYATRSGNTNAEYLYALDPADGSILWQSQDRITETTTESAAFSPDGDLLTTGVGTLLRIDGIDGTTVWETPRTCPTSGGCDAAVYDDRVYIWEAGGSGPKVTAFDLATGQRLYSSPGIGGGFVQQLGLFVGPEGTVYAPRSQNNPASDFLVALDDTGTEFVERWRIPIGYAPFASHAVGPDGSVYAYSPDLEVLRLDPAAGSVLDRSLPIPSDSFSPRIAVDASGRVYLTNGSFAGGMLFSYDADLAPRWSVPIPNVNLGGPAFGSGGAFVVCGIGTDVRAYRDPCPGFFLAYGSGLAGSSGLVPRIAGTGCPTPGGAGAVTLSRGLGGALGVFFVGLAPIAVPAMGGTLLTSPIVPMPTTLGGTPGAPGEGAATLALPIPPNPALIGVSLFLQGLVLDAGAPAGVSMTRGLELEIG